MNKIGRNDPCPCGSGLKYKKCCMLRQEELERVENLEWDKWFQADIALGKKNMQEVENKS